MNIQQERASFQTGISCPPTTDGLFFSEPLFLVDKAHHLPHST